MLPDSHDSTRQSSQADKCEKLNKQTKKFKLLFKRIAELLQVEGLKE
jgi:hypothetical protein